LTPGVSKTLQPVENPQVGWNVIMVGRYMLPGKVCGDVIHEEGEKWKIEERKKR
jgi:hypothetical protein